MSKNVTLKFEDGRELELPVNNLGSNSNSTGNIRPMEGWVVIGEYGLVDLLSILNNVDKVASNKKYMICGYSGHDNLMYNLGKNVLLSDYSNLTLKLIHDESNELSIDKWLDKAKDDKELVAANAIVRDKDKSKLGLNLKSDHISDDILTQVKSNEKKKSGSTALYKGVKVEYVNYFLTRVENIIGIDEN